MIHRGNEAAVTFILPREALRERKKKNQSFDILMQLAFNMWSPPVPKPWVRVSVEARLDN